MEKKGFKDGPRTYYYHVPFSYRDIVLIVITLGIVMLSFILAGTLPLTGITDAR